MVWQTSSPGADGSLPVRRVDIVQVLLEDRNAVQSPDLQSLDYIAACQDDYRVPVFADFPVSLT
jgi:hypothetical protein